MEGKQHDKFENKKKGRASHGGLAKAPRSLDSLLLVDVLKFKKKMIY